MYPKLHQLIPKFPNSVLYENRSFWSLIPNNPYKTRVYSYWWCLSSSQLGTEVSPCSSTGDRCSSRAVKGMWLYPFPANSVPTGGGCCRSSRQVGGFCIVAKKVLGTCMLLGTWEGDVYSWLMEAEGIGREWSGMLPMVVSRFEGTVPVPVARMIAGSAWRKSHSIVSPSERWPSSLVSWKMRAAQSAGILTRRPLPLTLVWRSLVDGFDFFKANSATVAETGLSRLVAEVQLFVVGSRKWWVGVLAEDTGGGKASGTDTRLWGWVWTGLEMWWGWGWEREVKLWKTISEPEPMWIRVWREKEKDSL